jgi:hypothetical protein
MHGGEIIKAAGAAQVISGIASPAHATQHKDSEGPFFKTSTQLSRQLFA